MQTKTLSELIDQVEGYLKEVSANWKSVEQAKSALNSSVTRLMNAQTELGKALEASGVVGNDFRLVNRQTASQHVLQHVFGQHFVEGG